MQPVIFKCTISVAIDLRSLLENNCEAGCRKMPLRGLSRMDRKTPVRFLGGWARATAFSYPTPTGPKSAAELAPSTHPPTEDAQAPFAVCGRRSSVTARLSSAAGVRSYPQITAKA